MRRRTPRKCRPCQRLVSPQGLAPPAQQEIANRPAAKLRRAFGNRRADANAGTEKLVGGLKPRRSIDGVAIGGVVEEAVATEVTYQRRAGMNSNAGCAEFTPLAFQRSRKASAQMSRLWAQAIARAA